MTIVQHPLILSIVQPIDSILPKGKIIKETVQNHFSGFWIMGITSPVAAGAGVLSGSSMVFTFPKGIGEVMMIDKAMVQVQFNVTAGGQIYMLPLFMLTISANNQQFQNTNIYAFPGPQPFQMLFQQTNYLEDLDFGFSLDQNQQLTISISTFNNSYTTLPSVGDSHNLRVELHIKPITKSLSAG